MEDESSTPDENEDEISSSNISDEEFSRSKGKIWQHSKHITNTVFLVENAGDKRDEAGKKEEPKSAADDEISTENVFDDSDASGRTGKIGKEVKRFEMKMFVFLGEGRDDTIDTLE